MTNLPILVALKGTHLLCYCSVNQTLSVGLTGIKKQGKTVCFFPYSCSFCYWQYHEFVGLRSSVSLMAVSLGLVFAHRDLSCSLHNDPLPLTTHSGAINHSPAGICNSFFLLPFTFKDSQLDLAQLG